MHFIRLLNIIVKGPCKSAPSTPSQPLSTKYTLNVPPFSSKNSSSSIPSPQLKARCATTTTTARPSTSWSASSRRSSRTSSSSPSTPSDSPPSCRPDDSPTLNASPGMALPGGATIRPSPTQKARPSSMEDYRPSVQGKTIRAICSGLEYERYLLINCMSCCRK